MLVPALVLLVLFSEDEVDFRGRLCRRRLGVLERLRQRPVVLVVECSKRHIPARSQVSAHHIGQLAGGAVPADGRCTGCSHTAEQVGEIHACHLICPQLAGSHQTAVDIRPVCTLEGVESEMECRGQEREHCRFLVFEGQSWWRLLYFGSHRVLYHGIDGVGKCQPISFQSGDSFFKTFHSFSFYRSCRLIHCHRMGKSWCQIKCLPPKSVAKLRRNCLPEQESYSHVQLRPRALWPTSRRSTGRFTEKNIWRKVFHRGLRFFFFAELEISCINVDDHFREVTKMIALAKGAQREVQDFMLTRYACYLIAQNGDPKKEEIAFAQSYFAVKISQSFPIFRFIPVSSIRIHRPHRIPCAVSIRANGWVLVRHWVDAQPHRHQLVVHVPRAIIAEARLLVAVLTIFNLTHWCSVPLTGCIAGERRRGNQYLLSAVM